MKKYIIAVLVFIIMTVLSSACEKLPDEPEPIQEIPQAEPSSPTDAGQLTEPEPKLKLEPATEPEPEPEPEPNLPPVILKMELTEFIGKSNGELRAAYGDEASPEIWYGGAPIISYFPDSERRSPVNFWLDGDYDEMMDVWGGSLGQLGLPPFRNIWPDSFTVAVIEVWQETIDFMYDAQFPVTPEMMDASFGKNSQLRFASPDDNEYDGFIFDVWHGEYAFEDYILYATFRNYEDDDLIFLFHTRLMRAYSH